MSSTTAPFTLTPDQAAAGYQRDVAEAAKYKDNPYGFDAQWYLNAYPDVAARNVDPLQHYLQYGIKEGRFRNPLQAMEANNGTPAPDIASGVGVAKAPDTSSSMLNPADPSSWAKWAQTGHAQAAGLNRLPGMAPTADTLSADPLATRAQFYPQGSNNAYVQPGSAAYYAAAAGANGSAQPVQNLGMGIDPRMLNALAGG